MHHYSTILNKYVKFCTKIHKTNQRQKMHTVWMQSIGKIKIFTENLTPSAYLLSGACQ